MNPKAMAPHGMAMRAFFDGDTDAQLIIQRDDGHKDSLPVRHFFREESEFTSIENAALAQCRGRVLDVGAGAGIHSLVLQKKRQPVTSIDISPQAVEIMQQRGVKEVLCADIFDFHGRSFDTILMMGHGIGIVESIAGLERFLSHARSLLSKDGLLLLDSMDVRVTDNSDHMAYHEANRKAGRYFGEVRIQFQFQGKKGPNCFWIHVDPDTLKERAGDAGWKCDVIMQKETGDYLAKLLPIA